MDIGMNVCLLLCTFFGLFFKTILPFKAESALLFLFSRPSFFIEAWTIFGGREEQEASVASVSVSRSKARDFLASVARQACTHVKVAVALKRTKLLHCRTKKA